MINFVKKLIPAKTFIYPYKTISMKRSVRGEGGRSITCMKRSVRGEGGSITCMTSRVRGERVSNS